MFEKILIANRGEIAVRIMKTVRKMGISTVAVYSQADTSALHVIEADEAVFIGPSPSVQSYLSVPNLISAIRKTGADAVHPGYGFLSENAEFAKALKKEGVTFIGPDIKAIGLMGDKIEAKKIARKANVNTVPGTLDAVDSVEQAARICKEIGYPVMIKAAAGGGGKGMRIVNNDTELAESIRAAAHEAGSSFSDDRVFIEKYIKKPRHIEIQVLGDKHGNYVYLGERECSIQRRHQKIIEEAPSPFLDEETRKAMGEQAVALAKAAGYYSAGTVEFIVDEERNFYFLEMNTRLQVEHRVTELITGYDLVELMIKIAAGEKLPFNQEDIKLNGWALESRIYSEDPTRGFLPSIGRITGYREPEAKTGILIDSGVYEGSEVNMFYDPMISKLCTYAETREKAIELMKNALSEYVIHGVSHNVSFLEAIINNERFQSGDMSTNFIAEEYPKGFLGAELNSEITRNLIAAAVHIHMRTLEREDRIEGQLPGRQRIVAARWVINVDGENYYVFVTKRENGYDVAYEDEIIAVRSEWEPGRKLFQGAVNGKNFSVKFDNLVEGYRMTHSGSTVNVIPRTPRVAELIKYMPEKSSTKKKPHLTSPLAGLIVGVRVKEGDHVKAGNPIILIEAMKMENLVTADHDVDIKSVNVAVGDSVAMGQVLVEFAEKAEEAPAKKQDKAA